MTRRGELDGDARLEVGAKIAYSRFVLADLRVVSCVFEALRLHESHAREPANMFGCPGG